MNIDAATKARLQAVIVEGRKRVEARRRRIAELACMSLNNAEPDQALSSADATATVDDCVYDADWEARLVADVGQWLDDDRFRTVTLDDMIQLGTTENDEPEPDPSIP